MLDVAVRWHSCAQCQIACCLSICSGCFGPILSYAEQLCGDVRHGKDIRAFELYKTLRIQILFVGSTVGQSLAPASCCNGSAPLRMADWIRRSGPISQSGPIRLSTIAIARTSKLSSSCLSRPEPVLLETVLVQVSAVDRPYGTIRYGPAEYIR